MSSFYIFKNPSLQHLPPSSVKVGNCGSLNRALLRGGDMLPLIFLTALTLRFALTTFESSSPDLDVVVLGFGPMVFEECLGLMQTLNLLGNIFVLS